MPARKHPRLHVDYTRIALAELDKIADWNERKYGRAHAKQYVSFLTSRLESLDRKYFLARRIEDRADLFALLMQRKGKANGHVAIFSIVGDVVRIAHIFHTSQDWPSSLDPDGGEL